MSPLFVAGSPSPSPWGRWRAVSLLSYAAIIAGVAALVAYAVLSFIQTPVLTNQWIPLWGAATLIFAAMDLLYQNFKSPYTLRSKFGYGVDLTYFLLVAIAALIALGGWAAGTRLDAMAWFLVQAFYVGGAIFTTVWRRKEVVEGVKLLGNPAGTTKDPEALASSVDTNGSTEPVIVDGYSKQQESLAGSTIDKKPTCGRYTLTGFNCFFRFVHLFFMAMLANGGIQAAINYSYPPRGPVQTLSLADNRTQSFHFFCQGASSNPTIFLDSSSAHGTVDFFPLQTSLVALGRRVCVYDPPSFGWSGALLSNEFYYPQASSAPNLYYDSLFEAMGEGGAKRLSFVAWGGGGPAMQRYASMKPEKVAVLGMLDVSPDGIEFQGQKAYQNLSDSATIQKAQLDITGRIALANIINSLVLPWGLMPIVVPPEANSSYYIPKEYYPAFRAQIQKDKTWIGQLWGIQDMKRTAPTTSISPPIFLDNQNLQQVFLLNSMPVFHVMTRLTDQQICKPNMTPAQCSEAQFMNTFNFNVKTQASNALRKSATSPVSYSYCDANDCDLGFPVKKPEWTAAQVDAQLKALGL